MIAQRRPSTQALIGWVAAQTFVVPIVSGALYALLILSDEKYDWSHVLLYVVLMLSTSSAFALAILSARRFIWPQLGLVALLAADGVAVLLANLVLGALLDRRGVIVAAVVLALSLATYFTTIAITRHVLKRAAHASTE